MVAALALCAAICAALVAAPSAWAQGALPATPVGASSAGSDFVFVNDDPVSVTLGQAGLSGPDAATFAIVTDACTGTTLAPGEACAVTVAFGPVRLGPHTAMLQVPVEGEPAAPFSAELSGEGIPWLRLTPSVLDFGTVFAFSNPARDVLVENVSGREISSLFPRIEPVTGSFARTAMPASARCPRGLAAGASCRVRVSFLPRPGVTAEARLVFGIGLEIGSVALRGSGMPLPVVTPIESPTPDATGVLRKRLRAALGRLRGRSRAALLRRGLFVRGIVPPAQGVLDLLVHARRPGAGATLVAARRRLPVQPGRKATIRARLTRVGRRLLRSGRPLVLEVRLTMVARSDDRLSVAKGVLRLGRVPRQR